MDIKCTCIKTTCSAIDRLPSYIRNKTISVNTLKRYMETRCIPRTRVNIDEILRKLGLDHYDSYDITRISNGVQHDDFIWFKFDSDNLRWDSVYLQR